MLKGEKISLYSVESGDLQQLMDWRNNPDFRKYFREFRELNMAQQIKWFEEKVIKDNTTLMFSVRRNSDNELLGCCGFVYINWVHRHADLSLYIGWKDVYIDNEGYAVESCRLLLDHGFKELCLNKVWTEIYEFDEKKKALFEKFRFHQDGLLRQNYWHEGKWWDSRIISLLSNDIVR
jgi:RimJ/RimL family protein N-acetyltransferase